MEDKSQKRILCDSVKMFKAVQKYFNQPCGDSDQDIQKHIDRYGYKLMVIGMEDDSGFCYYDCKGCSVECSGFPEVSGNLYMREKKLTRILNEH